MNTQISNSEGASTVNLRRGARESHSVAKRVASEVAFQLVFGVQNGAEIDEILHFPSSLFEHAFRVAKTSSFGGSRTSKT